MGGQRPYRAPRQDDSDAVGRNRVLSILDRDADNRADDYDYDADCDSDDAPADSEPPQNIRDASATDELLHRADPEFAYRCHPGHPVTRQRRTHTHESR